MTQEEAVELLFRLLDRQPDDIDGWRAAVLAFADLHRTRTEETP